MGRVLVWVCVMALIGCGIGCGDPESGIEKPEKFDRPPKEDVRGKGPST